MSDYYDLTGTNPACAVIDQEFVIFTDSQVILFNQPVFATSIVVTQLGGTPTTLVQGTDWALKSTYYDTNAMSKAKLENSGFTALLVNGIVMKKNPNGTPFTISIAYQLFYIPYAQDNDPSGPMVTPTILRYVVQNLEYLLNARNPVTNLTGELLSGIQTLKEDTTGLSDDNLIEEEVHYINVPSNKQVIRPGCGSFYTHDLVLVRESDNQQLVLNTDYQIIGPDLDKQQISQNSHGIYNYILILTSIVGNIKVTYRAFGGEVVAANLDTMRDAIESVITWLNSADLITRQSLGSSAVITSIVQRIAQLEELERHYLRSAFTIAQTNNTLHWYSIAYLYDTGWVDGNVSVSDVGQLRIQAQNMGWVYDIAIAANVNRTSDPLITGVLVGLDKNAQIDFSGYTNLDSRTIPKLRLIWKNDGSTTGAVLQLGIPLKAANYPATDIIQVTNKSSSASRWKIFNYNYEILSEADASAALPDGSTWDSATDPYAFRLITPLNGFLVAACNWPMTSIDPNDNQFNLLGDLDNIDVAKITKVSFHIFDRINNEMIQCSGTCSHNLTTGNCTGSVLFYVPDLCGLSFTITTDSTTFDLVLTPQLGTHSINNQRFDLRQIAVHFE